MKNQPEDKSSGKKEKRGGRKLELEDLTVTFFFNIIFF